MTTHKTIALLFSLFLSLSVTGFAQQDDSAKQPTLSAADAPSVTMSLTTRGVRFSVPGAIGQVRLEVFDHSGVSLYNSDFQPATVFDWPLQNKERQALADGAYLCVITLRGVTGKLRVKQGTVVVQNGQAALQLDEAQSGTVEPERALTAVADSAASPATVMVHDGQNGQVVTTGGALTFRIGNFFAGLDRERMRLTADGRLGIGTDKPEAALDVAGTIRARGGIKFNDGTVLTSAGNGAANNSSGVAVVGAAGGGGGGATASVAGTGTANKLTKWLDGTGTLGDSVIFEGSGGSVGINTTTFNNPVFGTDKFQIVDGAMTFGFRDNFGGQGYLAVGSSANGVKGFVGHTNTTDGFTMGAFSNHKLTLRTNNLNRITVDTSGNVGIGTTTPTNKLDVAGNLKLSGAGNALIFPDGTSMTTAAAGGGGVSGSGTTGTVTLWSGSTTLGNSVITQTGNDVLVNGNFSATGNLSAKYQDVAEWVPARGRALAGTVVSLDRSRNNTVIPSTRAYDTHVAGVVSARPGLVLGEGAAGKVMVATTGRVKVRVDATRLPVRIGDLLVTSGKPGVAMRSRPIKVGGARIHRPGTIVGKALEPLANGQGEILVLLSLQ